MTTCDLIITIQIEEVKTFLSNAVFPAGGMGLYVRNTLRLAFNFKKIPIFRAAGILTLKSMDY